MEKVLKDNVLIDFNKKAFLKICGCILLGYLFCLMNDIVAFITLMALVSSLFLVDWYYLFSLSLGIGFAIIINGASIGLYVFLGLGFYTVLMQISYLLKKRNITQNLVILMIVSLGVYGFKNFYNGNYSIDFVLYLILMLYLAYIFNRSLTYSFNNRIEKSVAIMILISIFNFILFSYISNLSIFYTILVIISLSSITMDKNMVLLPVLVFNYFLCIYYQIPIDIIFIMPLLISSIIKDNKYYIVFIYLSCCFYYYLIHHDPLIVSQILGSSIVLLLPSYKKVFNNDIEKLDLKLLQNRISMQLYQFADIFERLSFYHNNSIINENLLAMSYSLEKSAAELKNQAIHPFDSYYLKQLLEGLQYLVFDLEVNCSEVIRIDLTVNATKDEIKEEIIPLLEKVLKIPLNTINLKKVKYQKDIYLITLSCDDYLEIRYDIFQKGFDQQCGDYVMHFEYQYQNYFILNDGMGRGSSAFKQSQALGVLIQKMVYASYPIESALKIINEWMIINNMDETYTTCDIMIYNRFKKEIILFKQGSCDTLIFRHKKWYNISGNNLPIGIIGNILTNYIIIKVEVGDIILMNSDGVDCEYLKGIVEKNGNLIELKNSLANLDIKDDYSVIACYVS